jgi:energy-coupling factor transporter ATP-binding protein EcfA2
MGSQVVDVNAFDYRNLPDSGFILCVGRRGTGKTTTAKHLATKWKYCTEGSVSVMAGSESVKHDWNSIVPKLFVVDGSCEQIENMLDQQDILVDKYKSLGLPFPPKHEKLLILDDMASNKKFIRSPTYHRLASNSRHAHLTTITLAQYIYQITSETRTQYDLVFAMATSNKRHITTLHAEFCNALDMRVFRAVLSAVTEQHGALVIDNRKATASVGDILSYTQSPQTTTQRIGSEDLWLYSKNHYLDLDKVRAQRATISKMKWLEEEKDDDLEDEDTDRFDQAFNILDNRRSFKDRNGSILVRKVPTIGGEEKHKKD